MQVEYNSERMVMDGQQNRNTDETKNNWILIGAEERPRNAEITNQGEEKKISSDKRAIELPRSGCLFLVSEVAN